MIKAADIARDEAIASRESSIIEMDQMRADSTATVRTYSRGVGGQSAIMGIPPKVPISL